MYVYRVTVNQCLVFQYLLCATAKTHTSRSRRSVNVSRTIAASSVVKTCVSSYILKSEASVRVRYGLSKH